MIIRHPVCVMLVLFLTSLAGAGENWPQFRGPTGDGQSNATGLPVTWSETENVVWKTAVHGRAWSSPVVWGDQIWMTTATEDGLAMFAVCVDLRTGKVRRDIKIFENAEDDIQVTHDFNSFASPTPVIEQGRVYVHFGAYGTACLDTETGQTLWQRRDLKCDHFRGPGSSAFLFDDLLILHYDGFDVQFVVALNKTTGKTVWKTDRTTDFKGIDGDLRKAFSTPILIRAAGRLQLISPGSKGAMAYDPRTGKELWKTHWDGFSTSSRPLFGHGLVFISTGIANQELWAIRPDGRGDVTESHVVWRQTKGIPGKPSPLLIGEMLFIIDDNGVASCIEAKTGKIAWRQRIGGEYSASPIYADGRIYCFSQDRKATVLTPSRRFEQQAAGQLALNVLAENELDEGFMASPAVVGKALILRTKTHLYRIEQLD